MAHRERASPGGRPGGPGALPRPERRATGPGRPPARSQAAARRGGRRCRRPRCAFSGVSRNDGWTCWARSTNSWTEGIARRASSVALLDQGRDRPHRSARQPAVPAAEIPDRPVRPRDAAARGSSPGPARREPRSGSRRPGVEAGRTCSKLSSTRSSSRWARLSRSCSSAGRSPVSRSPSALAMAGATTSGSEIASRATNHAPSPNRSATARAHSVASDVLPAPPGPVRVTRRLAARRSSISASSTSRPTKLVRRGGRWVAETDSVRGGGKADGNPAIVELVETLRP